jgi:hypothetical protein
VPSGQEHEMFNATVGVASLAECALHTAQPLIANLSAVAKP